MRLTNVIKLVMFFVILIVASGFFYFSGDLSIAKITASVSDAGPLAALVFIGVFIIAVLLALPISILYVAGGLLFGPFLGLLYVYGGSLIGAIIAFPLGRFFGEGIREYLDNMHSLSVDKVNARLKKGGVLFVMSLRLIPFLPYSALNYFFSFTEMRFRDFFIGTALGSIPGIVILVYFGSSFTNLGGPAFWGLLIFILVILVFSWHYRKYIINKLHEFY